MESKIRALLIGYLTWKGIKACLPGQRETFPSFRSMQLKRLFHASIITYFLWKVIRKFVPSKKKSLPDIQRRRCIFITGAASGIGKETAQLFLNKGWFVGCYDANIEGLKEVYGNADPKVCCFQHMDVTDEGSCEKAINHFIQFTDNKMDVLFNCAGILRIGYFNELSLQQQLAQIQVNFVGLTAVTYKAFAVLKETENSQVINMSSLSSMSGVPYHAVYAATKGAVRSLTEALSIEFERYGIRVADISPGYIATPMVTNQTNKNTEGLKDPSKFGSANQVACEVWKAVNECNINRYHYYVQPINRFAFISSALLDIFGAIDTKRKLFAYGSMPLAD